MEQQVQFSFVPWSRTGAASPAVRTLSQRDAVGTSDEPLLTYYYPKSVVNMRDHSWCCNFYKFW